MRLHLAEMLAVHKGPFPVRALHWLVPLSGVCSHMQYNCCAGDLQAVLLREPELAARVVRVCVTGLTATLQAARGPPKPDKARIDRLAYVVSAPPAAGDEPGAHAVSSLDQGIACAGGCGGDRLRLTRSCLGCRPVSCFVQSCVPALAAVLCPASLQSCVPALAAALCSCLWQRSALGRVCTFGFREDQPCRRALCCHKRASPLCRRSQPRI